MNILKKNTAFRVLFPVYVDVTYSALKNPPKYSRRKTRTIVIYFAVINYYNFQF